MASFSCFICFILLGVNNLASFEIIKILIDRHKKASESLAELKITLGPKGKNWQRHPADHRMRPPRKRKEICGGPARVCCARAFLFFLGSAVAMLYFTNWCVCV